MMQHIITSLLDALQKMQSFSAAATRMLTQSACEKKCHLAQIARLLCLSCHVPVPWRVCKLLCTC